MKNAQMFVHGLADEPLAVEVEPALDVPGHLRVSVDGRSYLLQDRPVAGGRSLLVDGQQRHLLLHRAGKAHQGGTSWSVNGPHGELLIEVLEPLAHEALLAEQASGLGGNQRVAAYMPGKVVSVLVEEGEQVEVGQGIVVLEAMKMENEIQAETAGTLVRLFVEAGQAVDGGDDLFEVQAD